MIFPRLYTLNVLCGVESWYEKGKILLNNSHLCVPDADKHGFYAKAMGENSEDTKR